MENNKQILILGDGDCSFSKALARVKNISLSNLCATEIMSENEWVSRHGEQLKSDLEERGLSMTFGVDARDTDLVSEYKEIIFMFPFVPQNRFGTVDLIREFLQNVNCKSKLGTMVQLGLATQKARTCIVACQYGKDMPAEKLILQCIVQSLKVGKEYCLDLNKIGGPSYMEELENEEYRHRTSLNGTCDHEFWKFNDKTVFFLEVVRCPGDEQGKVQAAKCAFTKLRAHFKDRSEDRIPEDTLDPLRPPTP